MRHLTLCGDAQMFKYIVKDLFLIVIVSDNISVKLKQKPELTHRTSI